MANPHPAGNPNVGQEPTDSELRELSRKFEELLRRCEQTRAKEGEHQEKQFPDWYREPGITIPSWLSTDSPFQQPPPPQDRLAAVISTESWPSRGGFNWQVCLPTASKN